MPLFRFPLVAGLAMALTGMAVAQEPNPQAPPRPRLSNDARPTPDRDPNQPRTDASVPLKDAIVMKLIKANKVEIELAQLAQKKTDSDQLKQFTETLIQEHQALNEKLAQLSPHAAGQQRSTLRTETPDPQPVQQTTTTDEPNNRVRQAVRLEKEPATRSSAGSEGPAVPEQLLRIEEKACDIASKMTTEMLQKYEGQDFQMAFLGQQIVAHTHMLAHLQAIESEGPEELQATMKEAAQKTKDHLEQAKKLAQKLEDDRRNPQR